MCIYIYPSPINTHIHVYAHVYTYTYLVSQGIYIFTVCKYIHVLNVMHIHYSAMTLEDAKGALPPCHAHLPILTELLKSTAIGRDGQRQIEIHAQSF